VPAYFETVKLFGTLVLGLLAILEIRYAIQEGFRVQPGEVRKFKSSTHIHKNAIFRLDKISGLCGPKQLEAPDLRSLKKRVSGFVWTTKGCGSIQVVLEGVQVS